MTRAAVLIALLALCACSEAPNSTPVPMAGEASSSPVEPEEMRSPGAPAPVLDLPVGSAAPGPVDGGGDEPDTPDPVDEPSEPDPSEPSPPVVPAPCEDADGDTVCDDNDRCPGHDDLDDTDSDGVPSGCDDFPSGTASDVDGDGVPNELDPCDGPCPDRALYTWSAGVVTRTVEPGDISASIIVSDSGSTLASIDGVTDVGAVELAGNVFAQGYMQDIATQAIFGRGAIGGNKQTVVFGEITPPVRWMLYIERFDVRDCAAVMCAQESGVNGFGPFEVALDVRWELRGN